MNKLACLIIIILSSLLIACAPTFVPVDINRTVAVNSEPDTSLRICKNNEWYILNKEKNGQVQVPYGKRIGIAVNHYQSTDAGMYIETESCFPQVSFIPVAGKRYFVNFYINKNICNAEVMLYKPGSKLGFTKEETASNTIPACLP